VLSSTGDRGFESTSLQRRVPCEPDFLPLNSRYFRPVRRKETRARRWDLQFESTSLQHRVICEPGSASSCGTPGPELVDLRIVIAGIIPYPPRPPVENGSVHLGALTMKSPTGSEGRIVLGVSPEDLEPTVAAEGFSFTVRVTEPLGRFCRSALRCWSRVDSQIPCARLRVVLLRPQRLSWEWAPNVSLRTLCRSDTPRCR
jgi:hypothetical protein